MLKARLFAAIAGLAFAGAAHAQPAPAYTITKTVPLGAPDRWDYVVVDAPSHRVYVGHSDRVCVIDGRSGAALGAVEGLAGVHGVAVSAANGRGYTDDGMAGMAIPFDLKTFKTGTRIKAEDDADAIALDPKTGHVFVIDGDTGKITVIDPVANKAITTIAAGGKLEYAVADGAGMLFVNDQSAHEIVRIDTATNKVLGRWPMAGCTDPRGLAIDLAGKRLFSGCGNGVMIVTDAVTGKTVASLPIGKGSDATGFDPKRKRAFSSNGGDGTLTVIQEKDPNSFSVTATIKTAVTGRTMGVDAETGRVFIAAADVDPTPQANGRPKAVAGSLKLLFLDPAR